MLCVCSGHECVALVEHSWIMVTVGMRTLCSATYIDNFKLPLLLTTISDIEIADPLAQRWPVVGAWFERT